MVVDRGPLGLDAKFGADLSYGRQVDRDQPLLRFSADEFAGATSLANSGTLGIGVRALLPTGVTSGVPGQVDRGIDVGAGAQGIELNSTLAAGEFGSGGSYSVELWFKADSLGQQTLFAMSDPTRTNHAVLLETTSGGQTRFLHRVPLGNSGGDELISNSTFAAGQWVHLVAVNDDGTMRMYFNGVADPNTLASTNSIFHALDIGIGALFADSTSRLFQGTMDEIAIYDHALSQDDVLRHYQSANQPNTPGSPAFVSAVPAALQSSYTFVDNGTYTLTVTTQDGDGGFDQSVTTFDVLNVDPVISDPPAAPAPLEAFAGATIKLDKRVSDVGVNDTFSYLWEVTGDNGQAILTSDQLEFEFTPQYAGTYVAKLTVTDSDGGVTTAMQDYEVKPIVVVNPPAQSAEAGSVVTLTSAGSTPFAPAGLLRGDDRSVNRVYLWEFVDSPTGFNATQSVIDGTTGSDLRLLPTLAGDYEVRLTIKDQFLTGTTVNSEISNEMSVTFSVGAADAINIVEPTGTPVEGDTLEFSVAGLPTLVDGVARTYLWSVSPSPDPQLDLSTATFAFDAADKETYTIGLTVDGYCERDRFPADSKLRNGIRC